MLRYTVDSLQPGMVLAKPVVDERGNVLLRQGIVLTGEYIAGLRRRGFPSVYIADGDTDDIVIEEMLPAEVRRSAQATIARVFDVVRHVSADFAYAGSDAVVACVQDTGVKNALRGSDAFEQLEQTVTAIVSELMETDTLTGISQIRTHDDLTFSHSIDVTVTAIMIGKRLYLSYPDLKRLGAGCLLHDIGKVFVNPIILKKSEPLAASERERMREHPRLGYELLRSRNADAVMVNHVALQHHERQDGRGYPRGLHGTNRVGRSRRDLSNILLIAEIATVADVYDMLSAERPGRPALTPQQIADTMRRLAGSTLNRQILELFLSMLPLLPTGIDVVVRAGRYTGYRGVVVRANQKEPDRPLVRLLYNQQGERIVPVEIDLSRDRTATVEALLQP